MRTVYKPSVLSQIIDTIKEARRQGKTVDTIYLTRDEWNIFAEQWNASSTRSCQLSFIKGEPARRRGLRFRVEFMGATIMPEHSDVFFSCEEY